jgi:hypothetical protein
LAVADTGNDRVCVFSYDAQTFEFTHEFDIAPLSAPRDVASGYKGRIYVAETGADRVKVYRDDGGFFGEFRAEIVGGLKGPLAVAEVDGRIVVADTGHNRILEVDDVEEMVNPKRLYSTQIRPVRLGTNDVEFEWRTAMPTLASLDCGVTKEYGITISEREPAVLHKLKLTNLTPGRRFFYRVKGAVFSFPEPSTSRELVFTTQPEAGQTWHADFPIMVLIYKELSLREEYPAGEYPSVPGTVELSDSDILAVGETLKKGREFFFRNTHLRVNVDFDVQVIYDPLLLRESWGFMGPNERVTSDFAAAAGSLGKEPGDYVGVIALYAWENIIDDANRVRIKQTSPGVTYGLGGPWAYSDVCYSAIPLGQGHGRRLLEALVTQIHAQLDSILYASGYPSFVPATEPTRFPGPSGFGLSFHASALRAWQEPVWTSVQYGGVSFSTDADSDSVADDDPSLPFDEKRLGSSPAYADTDRDGFSDLQEATAGILHPSNPTAADTDGDRIADGADPYPLYPIVPECSILPAYVDGRLGLLEWEALDAVPNLVTSGDISGEVLFGWDYGKLYFASQSDKRAALRILIDAAGDGWYHGLDNYEVLVTPAENNQVRVAAKLLDPEGRRGDAYTYDVFNRGEIEAAASTSISGWVVECAIPRSFETGLVPEAGAKVKVAVALIRPGESAWLGSSYGNPNPPEPIFEDGDFASLVLTVPNVEANPKPTLEIEEISVGNPTVEPGELETRRITVRVMNNTDVRKRAAVSLMVPEGWRVVPEPSKEAHVRGERSSEVGFDVVIPKDAPVGWSRVDAALVYQGEVVDDQGRTLFIPIDWRLIGPFENAGGSGFDEIYPPEEARAGAGSVKPGIEFLAAEGEEVLFADALGIDDWATVYLETSLGAPQEEEDALFAFGAPGPYKMWLNGTEIARGEIYRDMGAVPGAESVPVKLESGMNRILVKLCTEGPAPGREMGFFFSVTDPDGKPLSGLSSSGQL